MFMFLQLFNFSLLSCRVNSEWIKYIVLIVFYCACLTSVILSSEAFIFDEGGSEEAQIIKVTYTGDAHKRQEPLNAVFWLNIIISVSV